ncbi:MAG: hypothetical protein DMF20_03355 [Verrucomicrobia bacterium]|nr:MAG: hypothetical protein DMF20_03355 [Verrucomicrobiota bacterium]
MDGRRRSRHIFLAKQKFYTIILFCLEAGRQNLFLTRRSTAKHKNGSKMVVNLTNCHLGGIFVPFARC